MERPNLSFDRPSIRVNDPLEHSKAGCELSRIESEEILVGRKTKEMMVGGIRGDIANICAFGTGWKRSG